MAELVGICERHEYQHKATKRSKFEYTPQPTFSTWPDLKDAITNEFDNPIDSRNIHILLTKRKKQQFESYYEYFLNMIELGSQGNLEEAVIIQYVIDGIPDQEFNKSILYGSTSYSDFKIKLKNYYYYYFFFCLSLVHVVQAMIIMVGS
ncbi:hypothetical protein LAZ67_19001549 [Cordylochernes scorpioides]|uniref:Retrotransposon gag domain-containing protein n=1 Tax=Cordylochernes scorpioides TaxID=51811 RepID=A0ABY6LHT0_9ARAC|nr:hypothetical protein LAZ67_19001549 [Cordylochernes scorpioides]